MKIDISLIEVMTKHEKKINFAEVIVNNGKPQLWITEISLHHPVPYQEFINLVRKGKRSNPTLKIRVDYSEIEKIAHGIPIYHREKHHAEGSIDYRKDLKKLTKQSIIDENQDKNYILFEGNVYNKKGDPLEIVIRDMGDYRTLIHEFTHLCMDDLMRTSSFFSSYEQCIEIMTEVALREDRDMINKIRQSSIKGTINRIEDELRRNKLLGEQENLSQDNFEKLLIKASSYPYNLSLEYRFKKEVYSNFFIEDLKIELKN